MPLDAKYVVKNENTLGILIPDWPLMQVLAGNIHGHNWKDGCCAYFDSELRPATLADFERFRVCPKGHLTA